jgi:hypothetical protein
MQGRATATAQLLLLGGSRAIAPSLCCRTRCSTHLVPARLAQQVHIPAQPLRGGGVLNGAARNVHAQLVGLVLCTGTNVQSQHEVVVGCYPVRAHHAIKMSGSRPCMKQAIAAHDHARSREVLGERYPGLGVVVRAWIACVLPSRVMSTRPRRVTSAAARSTRGSLPSGSTMRCRCSEHLHATPPQKGREL